MPIKWDFFIKRRKMSLQTYMTRHNLTNYDDLLLEFLKLGIIPPTKDEYNSLIIDNKISTKIIEKIDSESLIDATIQIMDKHKNSETPVIQHEHEQMNISTTESPNLTSVAEYEYAQYKNRKNNRSKKTQITDLDKHTDVETENNEYVPPIRDDV